MLLLSMSLKPDIHGWDEVGHFVTQHKSYSYYEFVNRNHNSMWIAKTNKLLIFVKIQLLESAGTQKNQGVLYIVKKCELWEGWRGSIYYEKLESLLLSCRRQY